jgi:peptidoglycan/LPS O-acetylase OafA/YrhL
MKNSPRYIEPLDGLRGLCIVLVLLHNLFPYALHMSGIISVIIRQIAIAGWVGVQWFFVLSGFLITRILLAAPKQLATIKNFYMRRCLRIFPVYYFTLTVLLIILPSLNLIYPGTSNAVAHQGWFWFYTSNLIGLFGLSDIGLSHFWSLAVEEQFYVVWPWLIVLLSDKKIKIICGLLIISAALLRGVIMHYYPQEASSLAYELTCVRWDALAIGALLAYACSQQSIPARMNKYFMLYSVFLLVWFVAVVLLYRDFKAVAPGLALLNQTLAALSGAAIIFICAYDKKTRFAAVKKMLANKMLCHLGRYSYAMYILHLIVAAGLYRFQSALNKTVFENNLMVGEFALLVATIFLIYILARLSWVLIESPLLKLKRFF